MCSMPCYAIFCVLSSFAVILMGKRKLEGLLNLSSRSLVSVIDLWLFLPVPRADQ